MALTDFGAVPASSVLPIFFTSHDGATGANEAASNLAVGDILVYKGTSMTQRSSTAGFALIDTDGIDLDGLTGVNGVSIDLSDNTDSGFYAVGSFYNVVLGPITIDTQTVYLHLATFRIVAAEAIAGKPKVDVDGFGGSAGTFSSGRPEVNTTHAAGTAWGSGAITAASIATDAITNAKIAADAIGSSEIADGAITAAKIGADAITNAKIADNAIAVENIADNAITAAKIAADAIGASELAADAASEIGTAVWATATRVLTANTNLNDPTAAAIADAVWDEDATGHQTGGTFGQAIGDPGANTETLYKAIVTDPAGTNIAADVIAIKAETASILDDTDLIDDGTSGLAKIATDVAAILVDTGTTLDGKLNTIDGIVDDILVDTAEIGAAGAGLTEAGGTGDHLTALATAAALTTVDGVVDAIKVTTDKLDDTLEDQGGGTYGFTEASLQEAPTGGSAPTAGEIADAVWEEALADHEGTAGSTAEALADAGGAGASAADIADAVLDEALSGHTTAGTLGKAIADIETDVDAVLVDTSTTLQGELDGIQADTEDIQSKIGSPAGASVSADIAAVKAQTAAIETDTQDLQTQVGVDGAGLTSLPWNASWDAEVQSEVADALGVYDPPTKAELDSAVAPLALEASLQVVDDFLDTEITAIKAKTDQLTFTVANQVDANALTVDEDEILDDQLTDSIPADGTLPTVRQALYMLTQFLFERSVSGTTLTVRKADGSTSLMTFTLNDSAEPTSITRAT